MVDIFGFPDDIFAEPFGGSAPEEGLTPGQLFTQFVATIAPTGLILNMPLNETGGTAADDKSTQDNNGTYSSAAMVADGTFLTGDSCPLFVPASIDRVTLPTSFWADFSIDECCVNIWFRVSGAGVWTNGAVMQIFDFIRDGNNRVTIFKNTTNNQIVFRQAAGATLKAVNLTISDTGWNMLTVKASKAADQMKAFLNGAQTGATQTGLGTAAGAILGAILGAASPGTSNNFDGYEAYAAVWATTLPSDAQILALYDFLV